LKRDKLPFLQLGETQVFASLKQSTAVAVSKEKKDGSPKSLKPFLRRIRGDARATGLPAESIDLIVTSPPYWQKRDYGVEGQIGQETTPEAYALSMKTALADWFRVTKQTGSLFLNVGDTYYKKTLAGIPARLELAASEVGWRLRNRIIWAKEGGMPEPSKTRLANRHEYVLFFTKSDRYYCDLVGYSEAYGSGANPGDVWQIPLRRNMSQHLAPFPEELVERAIALACPVEACTICGHLPVRLFRRTAELNLNRPQARRAVELARQRRLTPAHIAAIQATGISDAGKALRTQTGTGKNSAQVQRLAAEAKKALGGYFREFTFARKSTIGWTKCACNVPFAPAVVLDPFMGTGTTLKVAAAAGRSAIGIDLAD
jgi:DNA modification methylase